MYHCGRGVSTSVGLLTCLAAAGCGGPSEADSTTGSETEAAQSAQAPQWDGRKRRETDAIVTLTLGAAASSILLNGEPALAIIDNVDKSARILIPSDDTGISCENTFIVNFEGAKKGQLAANHCHGDDNFAVAPGEITDALLTKEEVDNPADDVKPKDKAEGQPLSFEWSANGFEPLPADYTWGGGKDDSGGAYAQLGVPETDDQIFSASCDGGGVLSFILLSDRPPEKGMRENFKIEVEGKPVRSYEVYGMEYGEGAAFSLRLPSDDPIFAEMASGDWAYWQMGRDSGRGKVRVSLKGARGPIRGLMERC